MDKFIDARLAALAPYTPGEQPQGAPCLKLNTNESPYPPAPGVAAAVAEAARKANRYPDPAAAGLARAMAAALGLKPEEVFLTNGSDEALAFLFQAFCPQGAAFADLTYGFYPVFARLYGLPAQVIPLREDLRLAPEDYANAGRTIFIANPNAPTGLALGREEMAAILRANPENLVVVDEAYVDFGGESAVPLLAEYENLVVVGTFSKSRALAGARLGYTAASAGVVGGLQRIRYSFNPYNLSRMSIAAGLAALEDESYFRQCRDNIVATREDAAQRLRGMGFVCTDSKANFLFARHPAFPGEVLYRALRRRDILVRWFDAPRARDYLRITVGTPQEMDALALALEDIIREGAGA